MTQHAVTVGVDYHQFYLWDPTVTNQAPEEFTDDDVVRRVKCAPSVVVVQPARNAEVPLVVDVSDSDPGFDASLWDHIVECSLDLPGGKLQVHECLGGPVLELDLTSGSYAARVLSAGLDTVSPAAFDAEDRYTVQLWPASFRQVHVVKQWSGAG